MPTSDPRDVHLTPHERFVLREITNTRSNRVGEAVEYADCASTLADAIRGAEVQLRLMQAAEGGVLTLDESVLEVVRKHRRETLESIEYGSDALAKLRAGDADYCYIGKTVAESERETRRYIDRELEELTVCDGILERWLDRTETLLEREGNR